MRTTICAIEAAGNSVKASSSANAIFFTMNQLLLSFNSDFELPERCRFSGLLMILTSCHKNSCACGNIFVFAHPAR
jgi:hypothetical protein